MITLRLRVLVRLDNCTFQENRHAFLCPDIIEDRSDDTYDEYWAPGVLPPQVLPALFTDVQPLPPAMSLTPIASEPTTASSISALPELLNQNFLSGEDRRLDRISEVRSTARAHVSPLPCRKCA